GMPRPAPRPDGGGERLTVAIGAGQAAEVRTISRSGTRDEEAHRLRRLRRRLLLCTQISCGGRQGERDETRGSEWTHVQLLSSCVAIPDACTSRRVYPALDDYRRRGAARRPDK